MSAQTSGVSFEEAVAHCHHLMDEAKVPREMVAGRTAGLIERVSWLAAEVRRLRTQNKCLQINLTQARHAAESRRTP